MQGLERRTKGKRFPDGLFLMVMVLVVLVFGLTWEVRNPLPFLWQRWNLRRLGSSSKREIPFDTPPAQFVLAVPPLLQL